MKEPGRSGDLVQWSDKDALTGLLSRSAFLSILDWVLSKHAYNPGRIAVVVADIQDFHRINRSCGLGGGDLVLCQCAQWVRSACRAKDYSGRVGDDQFALLLTDILGEEHAMLAAHKLLSLSRMPVDRLEGQVRVRLRIGLALSSESAGSADMLMQNAFTALYQAKKENENPVVFHETADERHELDSLLSSDLQRAIDDKETRLLFQPKKHLRSNRICGAEALIRWKHPGRGLVMPSEIIRLAQTTGILDQLTFWIVDQSLRACAAWGEIGFDMPVSVNFESDTFADPDLPERLLDALALWRVPSCNLVIELTESTLMTTSGRVPANIERLNESGVKIAIDDFGAGYSSLAYLSQLNAQELKIDKRFIDTIENSTRDLKLVETIIKLGHNLGLSVTAEGVERRAQYERLRQIGCDVIQGYFISKPTTLTDLEAQLRDEAE